MATPKKPEIFYIGIIRRKDISTMTNTPTLELSKQFWLKSFNRFTQPSYKQAMSFTAQTLAERTGPGIRQDVTESGSHCFSYGTSVGVAGILIANMEYPRLVAHQMLSKVVDEFVSSHPKSSYENLQKDPKGYDDPIPWKPLEQYIADYQNPENQDSLSKAQRELDETKIIMHKTIESVLERGEKIDNLVAKSEGLSASSKMFYSQAKKQNSCCVVM